MLTSAQNSQEGSMKIKTAKNLKVCALFILIILLVLSLTACGLFSGRRGIEKVEISLVSGVRPITDDGAYEAEIGKEFTLECDWHNDTVITPTIKWYVSLDGAQKQALGNKKQQPYTIQDRSVREYTFTVSVNDVECEEPIKVKPVNATLSAPTISSTTHSIVQGVIQQNVVEGARDVTLKATWNADAIDPDLTIIVKWYVNGALQTATEEQEVFVFEIDGISEFSDHVIRCELSYSGISQPVYSEITLSFVYRYKSVETVGVEISEGQKLTRVKDNTYFAEISSSASMPDGSVADISLKAVAEPIDTDLKAACKWSVRSHKGNEIATDTSREVTLPLVYGKNVISATVDNVESRQIIVYALPITDFNSRRGVIEDTFIWNGQPQDHYVSSQNDLDTLIGYMVSLHRTAETDRDTNAHKVYFAPADWKNGTAATDALSKAIEHAITYGIDESGMFAVSYTVESIRLTSQSMFGEATRPAPERYEVTQADNHVNYTVQSGTRETLPVDDFAQSMPVYNSNMLYRAVSWGYRPAFASDANGIKLHELYEKAASVLRTYIRDGMTELEKVSVIYEWIVNEIEYDYAAAEADPITEREESIGYNAFYLEGVFNDRRAVCDGKSKAFALLCGMEGIKAMRIVGKAGSEVGQRGGHAWNKVLVDTDGDGVRDWFVVDTTWGDIGFIDRDDQTKKEEYLSYTYFLVTDSYIAGTHESDAQQPAATTAYDVYSNLFVTVDGEQVSLNVTSKEQYQKLMKFSKQNGCCLNVRIDPRVIPYIHDYYMSLTGVADIYYIDSAWNQTALFGA